MKRAFLLQFTSNVIAQDWTDTFKNKVPLLLSGTAGFDNDQRVRIYELCYSTACTEQVKLIRKMT